jgi:hypothetical protein
MKGKKRKSISKLGNNNQQLDQPLSRQRTGCENVIQKQHLQQGNGTQLQSPDPFKD